MEAYLTLTEKSQYFKYVSSLNYSIHFKQHNAFKLLGTVSGIWLHPINVNFSIISKVKSS